MQVENQKIGIGAHGTASTATRCTAATAYVARVKTDGRWRLSEQDDGKAKRKGTGCTDGFVSPEASRNKGLTNVC